MTTQQPREYDAVLGGQNSIPPDAAVLGGIAGVKNRLASPIVESRIAALDEALQYGDAGWEVLKNTSQPDAEKRMATANPKKYLLQVLKIKKIEETELQLIMSNSQIVGFCSDLLTTNQKTGILTILNGSSNLWVDICNSIRQIHISTAPGKGAVAHILWEDQATLAFQLRKYLGVRWYLLSKYEGYDFTNRKIMRDYTLSAHFPKPPTQMR